MQNQKKILLNYIPPIRNIYPSAGLSILKSFLNKNGWNCNIIYWNILMESIMEDYPYTDKRNLIPFLFLLAQEHKDEKAQIKIIHYLRSQHKNSLIKSDDEYLQFLESSSQKIYAIIEEEFNRINFNEILLFGISLKFYQFIPALFFAKELKKRHPQIKIVIGGIRNIHIAKEYMKMCTDFDFAVFGEGEFPLLQLCENLLLENNDFNNIPRLLFRKDSEINESEPSKGSFLDFKNYIFPDYTDYPIIDKSSVIFPVNSIRSCYWDKCKFCIFGEDYAYREREPENIIDEIETIYQKYDILHFHFIDSDIIGTNLKRFIKLLDLIIESANKLQVKYIFWAEIIHKNLNSGIFRKMQLAGFQSASFGIESMSENLLKKMNKRTNLADNLFAIKNAVLYDIYSGGNVIMNLPKETKDDVNDCIANLHYLRFLFSDSKHPFSFGYRDFVLQNGTAYYKELSNDEIEKHNYNHIASLLPESFLKNKNRFNLFGYSRSPINPNEWNDFKFIENYYKNSKYSYSIKNTDEETIFTELKNNKIIYIIELNILMWEILKILNEKVVSLEMLSDIILKKLSGITKDEISESLQILKSKQIIYFNENMTAITSIIDTNKIST